MARSPWIVRSMFFALSLACAVGVGVADARSGSGGIGATDADSGTKSTGTKSAGSDGTFPVRGRHSYGDGIGAGRGHQGQDLLAKCGKPVVAARAGRVRIKDYQASGAGNYVVVKSRGYDHVYMHLLRKLSVSKGERVQAGDTIGRVGSTGRSSACHLHFEMWSKPGWYRGGSVINPKPSLKRWDRRS